VTTLAIAIDRLHSVYRPIDYLNKNKERYALIVGVIGCSCACIELVGIYSTTPVVPHPGCPSFGCFVNATYLTSVCYSFYS
jgi:hypothetical protein